MSEVNLNLRSLAFGFIAAALSVLVFHQGMILILHLLKYLDRKSVV